MPIRAVFQFKARNKRKCKSMCPDKRSSLRRNPVKLPLDGLSLQMKSTHLSLDRTRTPQLLWVGDKVQTTELLEVSHDSEVIPVNRRVHKAIVSAFQAPHFLWQDNLSDESVKIWGLTNVVSEILTGFSRLTKTELKKCCRSSSLN